jgi:hypothetical protein
MTVTSLGGVYVYNSYDGWQWRTISRHPRLDPLAEALSKILVPTTIFSPPGVRVRAWTAEPGAERQAGPAVTYHILRRQLACQSASSSIKQTLINAALSLERTAKKPSLSTSFPSCRLTSLIAAVP